MQTSFYHDKQHGLIRSVENVILTIIYTYHVWHHWLCGEWHLVPNCITPNWWYRTSYLPNFMMCWHNISSPVLPCTAWSMSHAQWAPGDAEGFIWVGSLGCWVRPLYIFGTCGTYQCSYWGMDHWSLYI